MIYLLLFLAVLIYLMYAKSAASPDNTVIESPEIPQTPQIPDPVKVPDPIPPRVEKFDPARYPAPKLWSYIPDTSKEIWIAQNYQDYIMPASDLVRHFADFVYLHQVPEWQSESMPLVPAWKPEETDLKSIYFEYIKDGQQFGQDDYWINPDYYIYSGFKGDCEDYALLWASVFEYWKVPYVVVTGYLNGERDIFIEFVHNDRKYRAQVQMGMYPRDRFNPGYSFKPVMMFNKKMQVQGYNSNW